jgi:replicative DNA helicase
MAAREVLKSWFAEFQKRQQAQQTMAGLATPWAEINALTYGLDGGRLYVIAGRPGSGKSVLGENLWSSVALAGKRALMFSLEMPADEMIQRSIASRGNVSWDYLRNPFRNADELDSVRMASIVPELIGSRLLIDDTPLLTIQQLSARAEREHLRDALSLIVVDHIHIMGRAGKNEVTELGEISRGLKALAKRLKVPVVALAQLNRGNTQRTDKRPTMADLRGSGEIEQDADVIWLAHREDYYHASEPDYERDHCLELITGKGRNMESGGTVRLLERFSHMQALDWDGRTLTRSDIKKKNSGIQRFGSKA